VVGDAFTCAPCAAGVGSASTVCVLCLNEGGALKLAVPARGDDPPAWVHVFCVLWTPQTYFADAEAVEGVRGLDAVLRAQCAFCLSAVGGCMQCSRGRSGSLNACMKAFHPECARARGMRLTAKHYKTSTHRDAFCDIHSPASPPAAARRRRAGAVPAAVKAEAAEEMAPPQPELHLAEAAAAAAARRPEPEDDEAIAAARREVHARLQRQREEKAATAAAAAASAAADAAAAAKVAATNAELRQLDAGAAKIAARQAQEAAASAEAAAGAAAARAAAAQREQREAAARAKAAREHANSLVRKAERMGAVFP